MSQQKGTFVAKEAQTSETALSKGFSSSQVAVSTRPAVPTPLVSPTNRPRLEPPEAIYGPLIRSCTAR